MPAVLQKIDDTSGLPVLPKALALSFVEINVYPILANFYHDSTIQRSQITDAEHPGEWINPPRSCRTFQMARRLSAAQFEIFRTFWELVRGGLKPFYFYNPYGVAPGEQVGSNWDATGTVADGRVIVVFRGDWQQAIVLGRTDIPNLTLAEVA